MVNGRGRSKLMFLTVAASESSFKQFFIAVLYIVLPYFPNGILYSMTGLSGLMGLLFL